MEIPESSAKTSRRKGSAQFLWRDLRSGEGPHGGLRLLAEGKVDQGAELLAGGVVLKDVGDDTNHRQPFFRPGSVEQVEDVCPEGLVRAKSWRRIAGSRWRRKFLCHRCL